MLNWLDGLAMLDQTVEESRYITENYKCPAGHHMWVGDICADCGVRNETDKVLQTAK